MNNRLFKKFVIDYYGNLPTILKDADVEIRPNGLMFCPMHDNYNTPAAKIFKDNTGWHFYCFSEQRQFGTYDVYKHVYGLNMELVFENLWNQLDDVQKNQVINMFGEYDEETPLENIQTYENFRFGKINYSQLKKELCNQIID